MTNFTKNVQSGYYDTKLSKPFKYCDMYCPNCKHRVGENVVNYCSNCGEPFKDQYDIRNIVWVSVYEYDLIEYNHDVNQLKIKFKEDLFKHFECTDNSKAEDAYSIAEYNNSMMDLGLNGILYEFNQLSPLL